MLHVEHIHKTFFAGTINEKVALQDLSLHLAPGDFVTVIGGNGAGKSTLLNSIAGVFPIDSGKIVIDGVDITKTPEHNPLQEGRSHRLLDYARHGKTGCPGRRSPFYLRRTVNLFFLRSKH